MKKAQESVSFWRLAEGSLARVEGQNFLALEKILPVEKHFEAGVKMGRRQGKTSIIYFPCRRSPFNGSEKVPSGYSFPVIVVSFKRLDWDLL